jgi:uncharacterized protein (DUF952 family)
MPLIYKIVTREAWRKAQAAGIFEGAAIDMTDGYIHMSDATQVEETVRRHFAGQTDLVLVAFDPSVFAATLKWEPSRGGALFPHIYGSIAPHLALWVKDLAFKNGQHEFPEGWAA